MLRLVITQRAQHFVLLHQNTPPESTGFGQTPFSGTEYDVCTLEAMGVEFCAHPELV